MVEDSFESGGRACAMPPEAEEWELARPRLPPEPVPQSAVADAAVARDGGALFPPPCKESWDDFYLDEEMLANADHTVLAQRLVSAREALTVRPPSLARASLDFQWRAAERRHPTGWANPPCRHIKTNLAAALALLRGGGFPNPTCSLFRRNTLWARCYAGG
jgi:hypothetical protein